MSLHLFKSRPNCAVYAKFRVKYGFITYNKTKRKYGQWHLYYGNIVEHISPSPSLRECILVQDELVNRVYVTNNNNHGYASNSNETDLGLVTGWTTGTANVLRCSGGSGPP